MRADQGIQEMLLQLEGPAVQDAKLYRRLSFHTRQEEHFEDKILLNQGIERVMSPGGITSGVKREIFYIMTFSAVRDDKKRRFLKKNVRTKYVNLIFKINIYIILALCYFLLKSIRLEYFNNVLTRGANSIRKRLTVIRK